ncbi:MAG: DUF1002 domain-containing protein [Candidatus Carbobacillus altaicus]|uniref:Extracellular protein n=1 Tax=Candidatus Carbonibacillus altaicus TaxID=2163959 RepID=A0A2R6Y267_9BACL|nr:DUF1002 domain-containing protein [Candidatus Carbobacillus altaicus]PTQ56768.1 MAG: hypothetical protein BSOLF_2656 [Candidatus Carbobacillus altaicus]
MQKDRRTIRLLVWLMVSLIGFIYPFASVRADVTVGDSVVVLGADLTPSEKTKVLADMDVTEAELGEMTVVTVTNADEHAALDAYISPALIGKKALSSARVTFTDPGLGLVVETNNITHVTPTMYEQALITAGVKDARIFVTAPYPVSGTAALTGMLKAFEVGSGEVLNAERKDMAYAELATTTKLAETYGQEGISKLVSNLKAELAAGAFKSPSEIEAAIREQAASLGLTLSDQDVNVLKDLLTRLKDANIDWEGLKKELNKIKQATSDWLSQPETQSFLQKVWQGIQNFFTMLWDWLMSMMR